ncbi:MAG: ORF6N domain-containing protein, partial [Verrucomicrobia bacterium]|nr:ORF6N domain-containing protein [Verrucomicrobiota bacterium]
MRSIDAPKQGVPRILVIRGQKVILDQDLARIYEVTTTALNQAVRRNSRRFPDRFLLHLVRQELR